MTDASSKVEGTNPANRARFDECHSRRETVGCADLPYEVGWMPYLQFDLPTPVVNPSKTVHGLNHVQQMLLVGRN